MNTSLKRKWSVFLIVLFVLVSICLLLPDGIINHDEGLTVSELEPRETVNGMITDMSYVNKDGVITNAIDAGYATIQRKKNAEGQIVEERYFDAQGKPVKQYTGYYGILYEYSNNCVAITYLGIDGLPTMINVGYSSIVRYFNEKNNPVVDLYYDLDFLSRFAVWMAILVSNGNMMSKVKTSVLYI